MACSGRNSTPLHADVADYFLPTGIRVSYVRCAACGLVQQYPIPADVGPFYAGYPVHANKSRLHDAMRRLVMKPVYYPLHSLRPDAVLLDYGCGDGWFLDQARARAQHVIGFEPTRAQAEEVARRVGTPVYHQMDELLRDWAGRVDVITMHFVLEHLTDLHGTFAQLAALLKPGGVLRAVVPNLDNIEYRWFGSRWHGFDAPRHICFPAAHHLAPVLRMAGLESAGESFAPFPNTLAASLCIAITGRYRPLPFIAFLPLALPWAHLYPRGTRVMNFRKS
ncbi:MAG TPA: class I SAM-dependent methyltransferase [Kiritimatiellia bacterium]|nr:class I SAM-dependent methyltransferase [Kiritimatiellia bacterium]